MRRRWKAVTSKAVELLDTFITSSDRRFTTNNSFNRKAESIFLTSTITSNNNTSNRSSSNRPMIQENLITQTRIIITKRVDPIQIQLHQAQHLGNVHVDVHQDLRTNLKHRS